jgi:hypothetical protein
MINKYKYLPAYRAAAKLGMYQPAQTIEALSHVGGGVVKIVSESGA